MIRDLGNHKGDLVTLLKNLQRRRMELDAVSGNKLDQPIAFTLDDSIWLLNKAISTEIMTIEEKK